MPSTRLLPTLAAVAMLSLAGCLGGAGFLGLGSPSMTVENRGTGEYRVSVTVVHTDTPWRDVPIELRYANGSVERTTVAPGRTADDPRAAYFVPENVTAFTVDGPATDHWNVSLAPSESASTNLSAWAPGDLVVVEWTRADGTVVRVKAISCRRGLQSVERYVDDARGGGGGGTSCTDSVPI
ncbi:hypothetical protein N0B31_05530 [Salinirubellus salinus]|uniref:Lipoprotein n=1 Tax=Salinirubellus salinus TaxID=1364945 RepID=A0A9E7R4K0_9EURY|nr:hypothetical protein [Salinirubellus salinus]UWM55745.1 hypothetical protein N0B31_05530 [Salinirubellus salinus]